MSPWVEQYLASDELRRLNEWIDSVDWDEIEEEKKNAEQQTD